VYRVYGGEANQIGRSWTPIDPHTVPNYRAAAGLPPDPLNTGKWLTQGTVKNPDLIQVRPALPFEQGDYYQPGGLTEYYILEELAPNPTRAIEPTGEPEPIIPPF